MANKDLNLVAVSHGVKDLRVETRKIPKPGNRDVLIRMAYVGICATDVHCLDEGELNGYGTAFPCVQGHESSGTVVECGSDVKHLQPGDRVAVEPTVPCGDCIQCKTGRYNICEELRILSCPPNPKGALCQYLVHQASFCHKLPDSVSLEEAAFFEPLSVSIHACRRANVALGSRVLVTGAGPIGQAAVIAAKSMGATNICIADLIESRLKLAVDQGATCTVLIKKGSSAEDIAAQVKAEMGQAPTAVIETTSAEIIMRMAVMALARAGSLAIVGLGVDEVKVPVVQAAFKEIDIKGCLAYANCYPLAIDIVASGQVNLKPMFTHRYDLKDITAAFETARSRADGVMKVLIKCSSD